VDTHSTTTRQAIPPATTTGARTGSQRMPAAQTAALVGAPLLLLAAHLLQPAHGTSTAEEVASQAAHTGAYNASTAVGLAAVLLTVPALLALRSLVADRRAGRIGGALAVAGAVGLAFLLGTGVGATTIADKAGSQAVALTDALESNPAMGAGVAVMLLGWTFGLITLAVTLGRSGRLPWWAAACLGLAPLVPAVAGGRLPVSLCFVLLLVAFGTAAFRAPATATTARELQPA
jgi:hypothetical protein